MYKQVFRKRNDCLYKKVPIVLSELTHFKTLLVSRLSADRLFTTDFEKPTAVYVNALNTNISKSRVAQNSVLQILCILNFFQWHFSLYRLFQTVMQDGNGLHELCIDS